MSRDWTRALLLRCYPPAWRARYGMELETLIAEATGDRKLPWKIWLDVARGGARERLRASGLTGDAVPPAARAQAGLLLVLCASVAFAVAGLGVQKTSEHWQAVAPASGRGLAAGAFAALVAAALIAGALVVAGIACVLPQLVALLRGGGWGEIRGPVLWAARLGVLSVVATVALVAWVSRGQRSDPRLAYELGLAAWALLVLACLVAWTLAAVAAGRRLDLSARLLGVEAWLATAVSATMVAMTVAAAVWWWALARQAPWFFADRPVGTPSSALAPQLLVALPVMLAATALAAAGAVRAHRALSVRAARGASLR